VSVRVQLTSSSQIAAAEALRNEAKLAFKDFMNEDSACRGTSEDPSGRYGTVPYVSMCERVSKRMNALCR
jgi:hypothetical protein